MNNINNENPKLMKLSRKSGKTQTLADSLLNLHALVPIRRNKFSDLLKILYFYLACPWFSEILRAQQVYIYLFFFLKTY